MPPEAIPTPGSEKEKQTLNEAAEQQDAAVGADQVIEIGKDGVQTEEDKKAAEEALESWGEIIKNKKQVLITSKEIEELLPGRKFETGAYSLSFHNVPENVPKDVIEKDPAMARKGMSAFIRFVDTDGAYKEATFWLGDKELKRGLPFVLAAKGQTRLFEDGAQSDRTGYQKWLEDYLGFVSTPEGALKPLDDAVLFKETQKDEKPGTDTKAKVPIRF